jgi:hypothetical protein
MRHAALERLVDVEGRVAKRWIDLEEDRLPLGLLAMARRVVLAELLRRQHGGNQCLGKQREIQVNRHDCALGPVWGLKTVGRENTRRAIKAQPIGGETL